MDAIFLNNGNCTNFFSFIQSRCNWDWNGRCLTPNNWRSLVTTLCQYSFIIVKFLASSQLPALVLILWMLHISSQGEEEDALSKPTTVDEKLEKSKEYTYQWLHTQVGFPETTSSRTLKWWDHFLQIRFLYRKQILKSETWVNCAKTNTTSEPKANTSHRQRLSYSVDLIVLYSSHQKCLGRALLCYA